MLVRNMSLNKLVGAAAVATFLLGASFGALASIIPNAKLHPLISSGALPDSPAARVDANTSDSPFSGVVSININIGADSYICSGALVGTRSVVSAGHCVDSDGNGHIVDLNDPNNSVFVAFNSNGDYNAVIRASKVSMNADYAGFGNCPAGVSGQCVNDDVSVITLSKDAPASAKIYKIANNPVTAGTHITMAGYGTSGDGVNGFYIDPEFNVKRSGENYIDLFDGDDEHVHGLNEVYYADFDGGGVDTFCDFFGACSPTLANDREAGIGPGDSGGPSFIMQYGEMMLVANNTFGGAFWDDGDGKFGSYFGGMILSTYADYLNSATDGQAAFVPEPGSFALFGMGALMLLGARRRSRK